SGNRRRDRPRAALRCCCPPSQDSACGPWGGLARPGSCFGLWQQQDFFCEAEKKSSNIDRISHFSALNLANLLCYKGCPVPGGSPVPFSSIGVFASAFKSLRAVLISILTVALLIQFAPAQLSHTMGSPRFIQMALH